MLSITLLHLNEKITKQSVQGKEIVIDLLKADESELCFDLFPQVVKEDLQTGLSLLPLLLFSCLIWQKSAIVSPSFFVVVDELLLTFLVHLQTMLCIAFCSF